MKAILLICLFAAIFSTVTFNLETVRQDLLDRHNLYRARHQAPNLSRLAALETIAQSYSEKLVTLGYLVHSSNTLNGNYIGENLYFGYNAGYLGHAPVDAWYDEIKDYDFAKSEFTSGLDISLKSYGKTQNKLDAVLHAEAMITAMSLATITLEETISDNSRQMSFPQLIPLKILPNPKKKPLMHPLLMLLLLMLLLLMPQLKKILMMMTLKNSEKPF